MTPEDLAGIIIAVPVFAAVVWALVLCLTD